MDCLQLVPLRPCFQTIGGRMGQVEAEIPGILAIKPSGGFSEIPLKVRKEIAGRTPYIHGKADVLLAWITTPFQ
ncbi:predicted protein [Coccidioides posadasii str. Silveira]|uniref:Predicted protein n=1 Tax=Coccidioides posadasii (strain RMSCC 757 / Silveira) TaxID=443226 RepID=E9CUV3_COCPS|nr:predicted protein [Coccidioides posadasii str. Silveira]